MSTASLTELLALPCNSTTGEGHHRGFCRASECCSYTPRGLFTIYLCSHSHNSLGRGCCFTQEDAGREPRSSEQLPDPFSDPQVLSHLHSPPDISSSLCQCAQTRLTCLRSKQFHACLFLNSSGVLKRVPLLLWALAHLQAQRPVCSWQQEQTRFVFKDSWRR